MKPLLCELSVHLTSEWRGRLLRTCVTLIDRLNPGLDYLLIDNASPIDPLEWLPMSPEAPWSDLGVCLPPEGIKADNALQMPLGRVVMRFPDAIGHFHIDPGTGDGPGRSNMTSTQIAYASGYQRSVYQETDCLFVRPYEEGFAGMTKKVGCQERCKHGHYDWNIWYKADLPWLVNECRFIERYDWPNQKADGPVGEAIYETLLGEDLEVVPLRGCRSDFTGTNAANLREHFPAGIDWLTHGDEETFVEFLAYSGHDDLIPMLQGKE